MSSGPGSRPFSLRRRNSSTSTEKEKSGSPMDSGQGQPSGFNRKRAEGRDKDSRKNLQLKMRKLNPTNTLCYAQILGTGMDTQDTSPSVLLFFDKQRFIFNAGEGLQRFCTEHTIKLSKIDHIFLSRVCSETAGGLPGLLLTLAGKGLSVNVWGPSDIKFLVDAIKSFIPNAAMVHTRSFGPASNYVAKDQLSDPLVLIDDEVIKLSAVILRPTQAAAPDLQPEGSPTTRAAAKPGDFAVIYICELTDIQGKFDPKRAALLGLKPGPKFRELQLGNSVKSDLQNIMVQPSDVMGPSIPGPIVLLVDCPTLSHFEDLLLSESLSPCYSDSPHIPKAVNCVIHLSPSRVTNTVDYQKWMSRFPSAQHIMTGHEMRNIEIPILKSSAVLAAKLNYLCPQFFPAPGSWPIKGEKTSIEKPLLGACEAISAENLLKFNLRPYSQLGLDRSSIPKEVSHSDIIHDLVSDIPDIIDASEHVRQLWLEDGSPRMDFTSEEKNELPDCMEEMTRENLEIVLLGTGSSQPSKYRNVSSILVNLFSKGCILFDCGEGTLGQLKRRFGVQGADDLLRGLRCIWISHIHADHHTGLARILSLRRELLREIPHESLLVIGPMQLKRFLDAYQRLEDLDMVFLDCEYTTGSSWNELDLVKRDSSNGENVMDVADTRTEDRKSDPTLFTKGSKMQSYFKLPISPAENDVVYPILMALIKVLGEAGLEALISFQVIHCQEAFGVALKAASRVTVTGKTVPGWKIVYSGDTRPCQELVKASDGATILIHEATFEDGMLGEAIEKNHSTTTEAVQAGESAGVYRTILTHFSQRYPKVPVFEEAHSHNNCIAFDMMSVNLADLPVLQRVLPSIKLLFKDEIVADDFDEIDDELNSVAFIH
ncbi:hypothetical protein OROMI_009059 [Orobanche minor]